MKRALLVVAVGVLVVAAAVYSRQQPTGGPAESAPDLKVAVEEKNPWTSLRLNNDPDQFQFVVVTDRTGGHRAKVFSRAVHQINLLQPEFVVSVGDLIEGYTTKQDRIDEEWEQFRGFVSKLEMPFFYVPGNHDLSNKELVEAWGGRFGRRYYHFVYKDVLFLAVNSEDPVNRVSAEQAAYFKKALDENPKVRWTLVFLHKPLWVMEDLEKNGWAEMEKHLAGRKYTVFCGHVHRYQKFLRNGMNYYQLATTGGGSRLRGPRFGEFDHVAWITMKNDGPRIANVLLDGVLPEDLRLPDTEEPAQPRKVAPTHPVRGVLTVDGMPASGVTVRFYVKEGMPIERLRMVGDGMTDENGTFEASTYRASDGLPTGEYTVTAIWTGGYYTGQVEEKSKLPAKYADPKTSPLRVTIKEGTNEVRLELTSK